MHCAHPTRLGIAILQYWVIKPAAPAPLSSTGCHPHPADYWHVLFSACCPLHVACAPGFGGATCLLCEQGTFSTGGTRAPCEPCGEGLTSKSGAPAPEYCRCPAGQGFLEEDDTVCQVCPANTYSPWHAPHPPPTKVTLLSGASSTVDSRLCLACPEGRISLPGAESGDDCCKWGRTGGLGGGGVVRVRLS